MTPRKLRRPADKVPVLGTAFLFALCSCGQALRVNQPAKTGQTLVGGSRKPADKTPAGQRKAAPAVTEPAGGGDPGKAVLAQIPVGSSGADSQEGGVLRPISAQQMMAHASVRYEAARKHWDQGELTQAQEETDVAFRLLMLVPSELDPDLDDRREELQLLLSRLVVTMSAARAGPLGERTEIPLVMNPHVERELRSFQTGERHSFVYSYRRSGMFLPSILKKLEEAHMPKELAWLPLIESSFNNRALSPARALGLWQFIPTTGYRFGLERDVWVDERMDPELATDAAIAYLRQLHQLFGDWSTAVAAYNCGENAVARAIMRQKVEYLDSFWDLFPILPYETARYVPRFMATLHIVQDPEKHGFGDELGAKDQPLEFDVVEVNRQMDLDALARLITADADQLRKLNPALRRGVTPPRPYPLRVPKGAAQDVLAKMAEAPAGKLLAASDRKSVKEPESRGPLPSSYRVRRGDTLYSIARRFRVSIASLVRANSLHSKHQLDIGQLLNIPRRGV